jgi:glycosyltransferase involved in cell wall biosynthesis
MTGPGRNYGKNYGEADIVTTPTQTAANLLKEGNFLKPVYPLSCGINRQKFHPGYATGYLRKRYQLPSKPLMLYVGRLDKEKNLADIFNQSLARFPRPAPHISSLPAKVLKKNDYAP